MLEKYLRETVHVGSTERSLFHRDSVYSEMSLSAKKDYHAIVLVKASCCLHYIKLHKRGLFSLPALTNHSLIP